MDKRKQSREEWEQEIRERQHNITPAEQLRTAHYVAKGSRGAPIALALVRFVLGGASLGLGIIAFSSGIPHRAALGVASLTAGCYLGFTAFRWNRRRG